MLSTLFKILTCRNIGYLIGNSHEKQVIIRQLYWLEEIHVACIYWSKKGAEPSLR